MERDARPDKKQKSTFDKVLKATEEQKALRKELQFMRGTAA